MLFSILVENTGYHQVTSIKGASHFVVCTLEPWVVKLLSTCTYKRNERFLGGSSRSWVGGGLHVFIPIAKKKDDPELQHQIVR